MSTSDSSATAASAALARLRNAAPVSGDGNGSAGVDVPAADAAESSAIAGSSPRGPGLARAAGDPPQGPTDPLHSTPPRQDTGAPSRRTDLQAEAGDHHDAATHESDAVQLAATSPTPSTPTLFPAAPSGTTAPVPAGKPDTPADAHEETTVSEGHPPPNDRQRTDDKVYAPPARSRSWRGRAKAERALAAEARERTRLMQAAHAEALAENSQRAEAEHAARFRAEQELVERQRQEQERLEQAKLEQEVPAQEPLAQQSTAVQDPDTAALPATAEPAPAPNPAGPDQLAALVASAKAAIDRQQALAEPVYVVPYTPPDTSPNPAATEQDRTRRLLFTLAAALIASASIVGIGDLVSGSLASQTTLLSPAPAAYTLLPVIFCWSFLGSLFAWRPSQSSAVRQRAVGRTFPAALAAAGLWLVSVRFEATLLAFCGAALCTVLLLATVRELNRHTARSTRERMLTDAPIELMAGFFLVVFASTLAALLHAWGLSAFPVFFACLSLLALGYVAMSLGRTERGRIFMAAGFAWGMFWLLVPRLLGPNHSLWVAVTAGLAGFVVLLATENLRHQISHAEHRAARGKRTVF